MKLSEILNIKKHCPLCDSSLNYFFIAKKKKIIISNNGLLSIKFKINYGQNIIEYIVDPNNNTFYTEVYDRHNNIRNSLSISTIRIILEYWKRMDIFDRVKENRIILSCPNHCYDCHTGNFTIDYKKGLIGDLEIKKEFIGLIDQKQDKYNIYKIYNDMEENSTTIFLKSKKDISNIKKSAIFSFDILDKEIKLPLIKFSQKQNYLNKINKMILFS